MITPVTAATLLHTESGFARGGGRADVDGRHHEPDIPNPLALSVADVRVRRVVVQRLALVGHLAIAVVATSCGGDDSRPATAQVLSSASKVRLPPVKATWHYQLQGRLKRSAARVYDLDGFDTRAAGRRTAVVCE